MQARDHVLQRPDVTGERPRHAARQLDKLLRAIGADNAVLVCHSAIDSEYAKVFLVTVGNSAAHDLEDSLPESLMVLSAGLQVCRSCCRSLATETRAVPA